MSVKRWEQGKKILNSYRVESVLGIGGASTVYLVKRITDGELFSLKVIYSQHLDEMGNRQLLFNELRTWIDLPDHPNITACKFFKTIEGYLGVFAEYVSGGTLKSWIKDRKVVELKDILDIAIQCSYGLQIAHDFGVVHQDVKPGNILMTDDGIPKITDFGLARTIRSRFSPLEPDVKNDSTHGSTQGLTVAYCSPEQFYCEELNHLTDIWSFGVTLAQMLTGRLLTKLGYLADEAFHYDFQTDPDPPYKKTPRPVVNILERCLKKNPEERWQSFNELNAQLHQVYYLTIGQEYPKKKPEIQRIKQINQRSNYRKTDSGLSWDAPEIWLERAFLVAGRDLDEMDAMLPYNKGSRISQALGDLETYEITLGILEAIPEENYENRNVDCAQLLINKALIHEAVSDWKGSVNSRQKAIKLLEHIVYNESRSELALNLAVVLLQQGWVHCRIGEIQQGIAYYDKSISLREIISKQMKTKDLLIDLAISYGCKGEALAVQKNYYESRVWLDKAIDLFEKLVKEENRIDLASKLALCYQKRALSLKEFVPRDETMSYLDKAIDTTERYIRLETDSIDIYFVCKFYMNRAVVSRDFGQLDDALESLNKSIRILERAVYKEKLNEMERDLTLAYRLKSQTLFKAKRISDADLFMEQAMRLLERLVNEDGREDLAGDLALAYQEKAEQLCELNKDAQAIKLFGKAGELLKWLVYDNGQKELQENLALTSSRQATLFRKIRDYNSVILILEQAVVILKRLVYQGNRRELSFALAQVQCERAEAYLMVGKSKQAKQDANDGAMLLDSLSQRSKDPEILEYRDKMQKTLANVLEK